MSGNTTSGFPHATVTLVVYEGGFRARCLALAGFILLVYDYFLTLKQEVSVPSIREFKLVC